MGGADKRIGQALVQSGLIDELQLRSAEAHQAKWGGRLHRIIVDLGFAREDRLADALAASFGAPRMKLASIPLDRPAMAKLDAAFCEQRNVFPCALRENGKLLYVAVDDPTDLELLDGIGLRADVPRVKPVVAGFDEIQVAILRHYRGENMLERMKAGAGIELGDDEAEVEITDPSGQVVMRVDSTPSAQRQFPTGLGSGLGSGLAASQAGLDDLLGDGPFLSEEEMRRLETVRDAQERGVRVLRAIVTLCSEKGVLTLDEYRAKIKRP